MVLFRSGTSEIGSGNTGKRVSNQALQSSHYSQSDTVEWTCKPHFYLTEQPQIIIELLNQMPQPVISASRPPMKPHADGERTTSRERASGGVEENNQNQLTTLLCCWCYSCCSGGNLYRFYVLVFTYLKSYFYYADDRSCNSADENCRIKYITVTIHRSTRRFPTHA